MLRTAELDAGKGADAATDQVDEQWGDAKAAATPSPVWLNKNPVTRDDGRAHRIRVRLPPTGRPLHIGQQKVATPDGAAAGSADTYAESHNRHVPNSHIGGSGPVTRSFDTLVARLFETPG